MRTAGALIARLREKIATGDAVDALRRHAAMCCDQAWVLGRHHLASAIRLTRDAEPFDGDVRIALVVVNYSTTRFLKLMLLTLAEQSAAERVRRVVIVDNGSAPGDVAFLRQLQARLPNVELVERHHMLDHARGLRAGVRRLEVIERDTPPGDQANVLLFCDPDVVFRSPDAIRDLSSTMAGGAALAGELRGTTRDPDIQASFLAVRRDVYYRRDVVPPVHHGSPTRWMQQSIARQDVGISDFPSNRGGFVLHRGRGAVAAAAPHFMGLADGERIWASVEARFTDLLAFDAEEELLEHLLAPTARAGRHHGGDRTDGPFDPAQPLVWSPGVLHRRSLETVVVVAPRGDSLQLSGFAPVLWLMFEHPITPADVVEAVVESFAVDRETAAIGVRDFAETLLMAGALRRAGRIVQR